MKKVLISTICIVVLVSLIWGLNTGDRKVISKSNDSQNTLATVKALEKGYLYEMEYYGDYGFENFLKGITQPQKGSSLINKQDKSWACSAFTTKNEKGEYLVARNFDWQEHSALFLKTDSPYGYATASLVDLFYLGIEPSTKLMTSEAEKEKLLKSPRLPFDGMNEYGLVVTMMQISQATDKIKSSKATIGEIDAIRLILDKCKTVEEAISELDKYNITFEEVPIHYFIADAKGKSAVIEYIDGKMKVNRNQEPWQVSTNFIIDGTKPEERNWMCNRYQIAYKALKARSGKVKNNQEAMKLLEKISQNHTLWSVVYNLTTGEIEVASRKKFDKIYHFKLEMKRD